MNFGYGARGSKTGRIHFMGVCGTAMAPVAAHFKTLGFEVTGSDGNVYPPMSDYLAERDIPITPFSPENLWPEPNLLVVGNAISRSNPEIEAALDMGLSCVSLPELLRFGPLEDKKSLVVTGTHGKTTTAALAAWALKEAGTDPSWMVGGVPLDLELGVNVGDGEIFVLEGDEYDTAFFDKRPKFVHYRPHTVILNNLEFDHADIYEDISDLRRAFSQLIRIIPRSGLAVANLDDEEVMILAADAPCPVTTYSLRSQVADWYGVVTPEGIKVRDPDGIWSETCHKLVGTHQGWNILATVAALTSLGVNSDAVMEAVGSFRGVKRRGELRGIAAGVSVYDDFAHHPTSIETTLKGFRNRYPDRTIRAVLEPRSNTMRRRVFQRRLEPVFDVADEVLIREVPDPGKAPTNDKLDVQTLVQVIRARGLDCESFPDAGAIIERLRAECREGDVVVIMSNGGFENIHERLLEKLGEAD